MISIMHIRIMLILIYVVSIYIYLWHYCNAFAHVQTFAYDLSTEYKKTHKLLTYKFHYKTLFFLFLLSPVTSNIILFFLFGPVYLIIFILMHMNKSEMKDGRHPLHFFYGSTILMCFFSLGIGVFISTLCC